MKCSLCQCIAIDGMMVECGNNAEYQIYLNLCFSHSNQADELGYQFEEKYSHIFEQLLAEKWL
jgi:hypothetical protein